ncbi:aminopeptidase [Apibacter sp. HY039]|uniref:aminopeptidase n=1 Tax=Apibacter sp. HY039 TaxID=2501476 RepID=UPI000FEBACCE|nr:aminopeptidase [Apibacter sp. HY039]
MKKILFFLFVPILCFAQKDYSSIQASLDTISNSLGVNQKIIFINNTGTILNSIYLHAVANSYSGNNTVLGKRKLEDRNKSLYFSKFKDRGKINDLQINFAEKPAPFILRDLEFYEIYLLEPLLPNDSVQLDLKYTIKIPSDKISGYGYSPENNYLLKYFFLQPLDFVKGKPLLEAYTDTEFNPYRNTKYEVSILFPEGFTINSDLIKISDNHLAGENNTAITLFISKIPPVSFNFEIKGKKTEVVLGYKVEEKLYSIYKKNIERELNFLNDKLGELPSKIFISSKVKKNQNFIGIDDVDLFGIKEWALFSDEIKSDLKLFQQIAYEVINSKINVDKNLNHWIPNGLLTYYQLQYLKTYYNDTKLLGDLPDKFKIFSIKPLKYFFISKVPLTDRYKLGYRYIATQNYDQPINEKYLELSNINQFIISGFKTGLSFNFLSEYLNDDNFQSSVRQLIDEKIGQKWQPEDLRNTLEKNSGVDLNWFFQNYINTNDRINFKILKFHSKNEDSIDIKIKNKTALPVPILISGEKKGEVVNQKWIFSTQKDSLYTFPKGNYNQLSINRNYLFPEINDNDNILNTEGVFKNRKRIQMKFYADVDNPNYNQIFYEPKLKWNDYDKFIIGLRFYNRSPFSRPFEYSIAPTYSTGTNSLTGSAVFNYNYDMEKGLFRRIALSSGYNYYHYDKNLSYKKYSAGLGLIFKKRPRSEINQVIGLSFNSVDRERNPNKFTNSNDYSQYNLLDISYTYSDKKVINEWSGKLDFQHSNLFNKVSSEIYYRHEYAPNKKITLRFFGGYFLNNKSNSTYFDFGIDHITDYSFNYVDYLGRSATNGLLYQQYIMAEGGFKSMVDKSASKWITAINGEIHLWKPFDLYADVGVYQGMGKSNRFIYDTGVKLKIIPDFLELYFPIQSTLGFEPGKDKYLSHIRFTFNLNLQAAISHFRRGWY